MRHTILILLFVPTFLFSQGWEKKYGGSYYDTGHSVQQTSDGGYVITGYTTSYGSGDKDIYLIKTDSFGDTLWTKTFGGEFEDWGYSVQQTIDGGYIITGSTKSYGNGQEDVYLIKTDSNGDTLWTKTFGGEFQDSGYSVQQTTDGGYIVTGITALFESFSFDVYLIKTDGNGDSLWTKTFGGVFSDWGYTVQQTFDGGYIITGVKSLSGSGQIDAYLIKTDSNGDTLWTKTFGGDNPDIGRSVQQTIDGGYIITGSTLSFGNGENDVYLFKTDSNGILLWSKTFGGDSSDGGSSVQQTNDGGYIITGSTLSFGDNSWDVYLIKTDSNGDDLWTRIIGGAEYDVGRSIQQTSDGGYIITGTTERYGYEYDVYLIKTDEDGIVTFTTEIPIPDPNKKLIKVIDLSGREIIKPPENSPYIEIYNDGTSQKKMIIK